MQALKQLFMSSESNKECMHKHLFNSDFFEALQNTDEEKPIRQNVQLRIKKNTSAEQQQAIPLQQEQQQLNLPNFFDADVQPFMFYACYSDFRLYKIFLPTQTNPLVRSEQYFVTKFDSFPLWYSSIVTNRGEMFIMGGCDPRSETWEGPKVDWILRVHTASIQHPEAVQQKGAADVRNKEKYTVTKVGRLTLARDVMGSCYHNGYVYLVGGRNTQLEYTRIFERFSVDQACSATDFVCERLKDCLTESGQSAVIALQNRYLYKIGGWKRRYIPNECIERYDLKSQEWEIVADFSKEKSLIRLTTCGSVCQIGESEILCFGGWYDDFNSITERTFVIESQLDAAAMILKHNKSIMHTRGGIWFPQCIALDGKIYALQNIESPACDGCFLNNIQRLLCFDGVQWITIPIPQQHNPVNQFDQLQQQLMQQLIQMQPQNAGAMPQDLQNFLMMHGFGNIGDDDNNNEDQDDENGDDNQNN